MPNKTIYVSDDDLPLFERAQELAGSNLSSAIVRALRRFVELEEASQRGLDEITVIVNREGAHLRKRFIGQRLLRWVQKASSGEGTEIQSVYRTAGKRYALHTRILRDWDVAFGDPDINRHPKNFGIADGIIKKFSSWGYDDWEAYKDAGDYSLQVFETLEALKGHLSEEAFQALSLAMEGPEIEDLDI